MSSRVKYILLIVVPILLIVSIVLIFAVKKEKFEVNLSKNDGNLPTQYLNDNNNIASINNYAKIDTYRTNYPSGRRVLDSVTNSFQYMKA